MSCTRHECPLHPAKVRSCQNCLWGQFPVNRTEFDDDVVKNIWTNLNQKRNKKYELRWTFHILKRVANKIVSCNRKLGAQMLLGVQIRLMIHESLLFRFNSLFAFKHLYWWLFGLAGCLVRHRDLGINTENREIEK